MKHKIILTVETPAGFRETADAIRQKLHWMAGAAINKQGVFFGRVTVKKVKGWGGNFRPAKVSVRRLKSGRIQVYASGKPLGSDLATVKEARQFLRSRHPSLAQNADYSKA